MDSGGTVSGRSTVVIKVGTSSLIRQETLSPNLSNLAKLCEAIKGLRDAGHRVCLVSSGAIGMGCQLLQVKERPKEISKLQALAAVGQGYLLRLYSDLFSSLSMTCAQVLVTAESLASKRQCLRAESTLAELLALDVVPIVNENDTINVQEIRIGDNDTLAAQVAVLVQADWLFLLTDVDFLYTGNPSKSNAVQPIKVVEDVAALNIDTDTKGTKWGTGGMETKLIAARIACASGCQMAICHCQNPFLISKIMNGEQLGTVFRALATKVKDRKRWILSVPVRGKLHVDLGCARAIQQKKNLYAAGIIGVGGHFGRMDAVELVHGEESIARGLTNYSSQDIARLQGKHSSAYPDDLKYLGPDSVIFRDNLALVSPAREQDSMT